MLWADLGDIARPDLPKPNCRVILVCGPPASGKSTYVKKRAASTDIVIDLDLIARERGYGRDRPATTVRPVLLERNRRLASLADEPRERVAWVILAAPSRRLRAWWRDVLGVAPGDLVLLVPSRDELRRRIMRDPDRALVRTHHIALVDKWLAREREDDPGISKRGVDADGFPTDPLHPLNRRKPRPPRDGPTLD